jgi:hypothetical protein
MPWIYFRPHSDKMSVEHPMPYALGRFADATQLRDHVCRACNTEISKGTEMQLLRAGPTGVFHPRAV